MEIKKLFLIALRSVATCLLFAVCMAVGVFLSGLTRVAPQGQQAQGSVLIPVLLFSACVGLVASYLILRSSWHGWALIGAMFFAMYGISTVVSQIESVVFLPNKLGPGMLRAIFLQGAIGTAFFAPLAVLLLGKWRAASTASVFTPPVRMRATSAAWRVALLVIAFVFLYMFFGYYVAWQNPELRKYYGGPDWPNFFAAMKGNWQNSRWIFPLASFRALLYVIFVFPLIRMLRVARWESAAAVALFLSSWTTVLLMPNPLMPASVARSHFWETLGFSLIFGALLGWLMNTPAPKVEERAAAA